MNIVEELLGFIEELKIIDTHEHLPMETQRSQDADVLSEWLTHYFSCDLVSAGLKQRDLDVARRPGGNLKKRWKMVEPYWHAARSTGYGRALDISARDLYGIEGGVTGKTLGALNEAFVAARAKGGHYQYVLKDKSRIALSITDCNPDCDRKFFASTGHLDEFIVPGHRNTLRDIGHRLNMQIHTLDDLKAAMEVQLDQLFANPAVVTLKCGMAYQRSLQFAKTTAAEAEPEFNRLFSDEHSPAWRPGMEVGKALQDHMMHHLLKLMDARGLPIQFHTGLQEGNGNIITDSNPVLLTNLFVEYENVKFDIFHMSYPYMAELSNLAKNFRNVFIDMCWGHIISPEAARRALVEWLDAVPANKISAFGGDYCFIDGVYGHQWLARQNVAASLAQKVADGAFDLDRAKEIARWLFVDNPVNLFGLADNLKASTKKTPKPRKRS